MGNDVFLRYLTTDEVIDQLESVGKNWLTEENFLYVVSHFELMDVDQAFRTMSLLVSKFKHERSLNAETLRFVQKNVDIRDKVITAYSSLFLQNNAVGRSSLHYLAKESNDTSVETLDSTISLLLSIGVNPDLSGWLNCDTLVRESVRC